MAGLEDLVKVKDRNSDGSIEALTREIMDSDNFDLSEASKIFAKKQSIYENVTVNEGPLV
ncbi:hypothetical protein IKI14_05845 [bacterium]|nr:hypothetical protein [bacterium]